MPSKSSLSVFSTIVPDKRWTWLTARRQQLAPAEMETSHLFHTLRMIWNNFMPAHMRVGAVKLYTFNPDIWPESYLGQAIRQIGRELFNRRDIAPWQKYELERMAEWLTSVDPALPVPLQRLAAPPANENSPQRSARAARAAQG